MKSFLHPSFVVRDADDGIVMEYAQFLNELPTFFHNHPEYKQSVKIEALSVQADTATLATQRVEVLHVLGRFHTIASRWSETWKTLDNRWVLVEERPSLDTGPA